MKFPKENILDKSLKDFEKKHPFLSRWIRLKIKIKLMYFNYIKKV